MTTTAQSRPGTFTALRNPNFRLYFAGQLASTSGTWVQNVAQGFLVFSLTQSELWLGIVACAAGLPQVLLSPVAGVIVERFPRRQIMLVTQTIQMILAFILSALTFTGSVQVWHIVTLAFVLGLTNAVDAPARQTFVVEMVGRDELQSGITLNSMLNSGSRLLGPAAAGIALVQVGPAWCFFLNGLTFLAVIVSLLIMDVPYAIKQTRHAAPLQQLKEGLNFVRRDESIAPLLLLTAQAGLFGVPVVSLLPAFAAVVLNSPKEGYAAIAVGQGVGSVIAGLVTGWLTYRLGRGRLIAVMVMLSAASTYLMSRMNTIPTAVFACSLSGFFLVLQVVSVNTQIQHSVPDEFRGPVMSLYALAFFGFAPFGSLALGLIANEIGTPSALALYGLLSALMGGYILLRWRSVARHR